MTQHLGCRGEATDCRFPIADCPISNCNPRSAIRNPQWTYSLVKEHGTGAERSIILTRTAMSVKQNPPAKPQPPVRTCFMPEEFRRASGLERRNFYCPARDQSGRRGLDPAAAAITG
jgi:hypothetical protein